MSKPQGSLTMVISLVVVGLVVMTTSGCDSAGAGAGADAKPITAAAALAALPTAAQGLGLHSTGDEGRAVSARSAVAGADWMTRCDSGGPTSLCDTITNGVGEFLSGDSFIGILKSIASLEDLTLVMNEPNRLESIPGAILSEPGFVDLGVLLITAVEETILLQWTINYGAMYYIEAEMTGWPEITGVEFWMINDKKGTDPYRWEYQNLDIANRSATKYVTQPNESGETRDRHERYVFQGDGSGGLDGVFSRDEPGTSGSGFRSMSSFSIRSTSAGVVQMEFDPQTTTLISNTEAPSGNTTISILDTALELAFTETSDESGAINQTVFGRELSLSRDPGGEPAAADTATRDRLLGANLQALFFTWTDLQLPSGADRPSVPGDFPVIPDP